MKRVRVEVEFAIVPIWLLTADVSAQAVRIYGVLARLGYKGQVPHPSHKDLGETARCSTATVRRALAELAALGAIEVKPRIDGRGRDSNAYIVKVNRPLLIGEQAGLFTDEQAPRSQVSTPKEPEKDLEVEKERAVPAPSRKRDEIHHALAVVEGADSTQLTRPHARRIAVAAAAIRAAVPDVSPSEIYRRAATYQRLHPEWELTANALASHWASVAGLVSKPEPRSRRVSELTDEELEAMRA